MPSCSGRSGSARAQSQRLIHIPISSPAAGVQVYVGCNSNLSTPKLADILLVLISKTNFMSRESRRLAGILLIVLPTVMYGGVSLLMFLINDPKYMENPLRQNLFRAGHAHAGVLLILSLVALKYVDETNLSKSWKWVAAHFIPIAAILMPAAFFFSVLKPEATEPNGFINLAYIGAVILATGVLTLGIGLVRGSKQE